MKKIIILIIPFLILQCGQKTPPPDKKALPSALYVVAKKGLLLRSEPSQSSKTVTLIPFNTKVNIVEASEQSVQINGVTAPWYKVKWNTNEGWAFSGYLKPIIAYPEKILMYSILYINSYIPANILNSGNKTRLNVEDFISVPDILMEPDLVVIDKDEVYNDSIGDIYIDFNSESTEVIFNLKSGKKHQRVNTPVYFRKNYYDSLSKNPPLLVKMQNIADKDLSEKIYKTIREDKSLWLANNFDTSTNKHKDQESVARKYFDLSIYELSENGNEIYLATLQSKDKETWYYNAWILISNGKIVFTGNGNFINSFTINKSLYILFDIWTPHSGDSGREIFINKNGVIEKFYGNVE